VHEPAVESDEPLDDEQALRVLNAGAVNGDLAELPEDGIDLRAHLLAIERRLVEQALARAGGTVAHAARLLNLRRTTLVERLRKLGLAAGTAATEY